MNILFYTCMALAVIFCYIFIGTGLYRIYRILLTDSERASSNNEMPIFIALAWPLMGSGMLLYFVINSLFDISNKIIDIVLNSRGH